MDVKITLKDGTSFKLSEAGITVTDFVPESIEMDTPYQEVDGLHGKFEMGAFYRNRGISVPCFFKVERLSEYAGRRDEIFDKIVSTESYYIQEMRRPRKMEYEFRDTHASDIPERYSDVQQTDNELVSGKRYLVRLANVITPEQSNTSGSFKLEFETTELPFAESVGTSKDIKNALQYDQYGLFSYGMGLSYSDGEQHKYTFENLFSFRFYYPGTVANDQFNMYKKFKFTFNESNTGFAWRLTGTKDISLINVNIKAGDVVEYDGTNVTLNGLSVLNGANLEIPAIVPGWNSIVFDKLHQVKVEIDCRFYYK